MDLDAVEAYARTVFLKRLEYQEGLSQKKQAYDETIAREALIQSSDVQNGLPAWRYLFHHLTRNESTIEQLKRFLALVEAKRQCLKGVPEAEALDPLFSQVFRTN